MKSVFTALAMMVWASSALAGGAVEYTCIGQDKVSGSSVAFEVLFADHAREAGYTNQSITITKKGWEQLEKPVVFQMFGATKKNTCKKNSEGEIKLKTDIKMTPAPEALGLSGYTVEIKSNCADAKVDIKGLCLFQ